MQSTRLRISSVEITWLTGSCTVEPGSTSAIVGSPSSPDGGRRLAERHVGVQRRVLVARGRLDGRDDLARDAQLREVAEARLALGAVVPDRLVEAHQPLLDQVVRVASDQEVRRGLQPHEPVVAAHQAVLRLGRALLGQRHQVLVVGAVRGLGPAGCAGRRARDAPREPASGGMAACRFAAVRLPCGRGKRPLQPPHSAIPWDRVESAVARYLPWRPVLGRSRGPSLTFSFKVEPKPQVQL